MDKKDAPWLTEFTVTPLITHAVESLRALIPDRESIVGIKIELEGESLLASYHDPTLKWVWDVEYFTLSQRQDEAARMLLAVVNYQCGLIREHYTLPFPPNTSLRELKEIQAKLHEDIDAMLHGAEPFNPEVDNFLELESDIKAKLRCEVDEGGYPEPPIIILR